MKPALLLTALIALPTLADNAKDGLWVPDQFTRDSMTQGQSFIADAPLGALGIRFSGGVVVDLASPLSQDRTVGLEQAEDARTYLGVGVTQSVTPQIDFSADFGLVEKDLAPLCPDEGCLGTSPAANSRSTEPVMSLGLRYRF